MINFSQISDRSSVGAALRFPLKLIPRKAVVPVIQGPLKGKRWVAGSLNHGCWLGSYELAKQTEMLKYLKPGLTCYDIGANVGYYTLLMSSCVGPTGAVHAFEPVPENVDRIEQHVALNHLTNVQIHKTAVGDANGVVRFQRSESCAMGKISESGDLEVALHSIDELLSSGKIDRAAFVKIDVEGAEGQVLRGAKKMLAVHRPVVFVATHGEHVHQEVLDTLGSFGYEIVSLSSDELIGLPRGERATERGAQ